MKDFALIPSYCPNECLVTICNELRSLGFKVIVVDDGSPHSYQKIFTSLENGGFEVLHFEHNQGKGEALKLGFQSIVENQPIPSSWQSYYVATVDADGQHNTKDVKKCLEAAKMYSKQSSSPVLVLGSRFSESIKIPLRSRIGNSLMRSLFSLRSHVKIRDTQTGLRIIPSQLLPTILNVSGSRYEYETNVLIECADMNIDIKEIPIQTIYEDGNSSSHFNAFRDSWRILKQFLKFSLSSFSSFLIDYTLYALLVFLLGSNYIVISNVVARIASATCNYIFNSRLVFKESSHMAKTATEYAALAVAMLALNTLALVALVSIGLNAYIAKILTEALLFIVNFLIQKYFIFKKTGDI